MMADWLWDKKVTEKEADKVLKDPGNRGFHAMAALLLSRKNSPREVFKNYLDPAVFCREWSSIKRRMRRDRWNEPRVVFWQAVYEKVAEKYRARGTVFRRKTAAKSSVCRAAGESISALRRAAGLTQKGLAGRAGVSQQLISRIEKGKENASLETLGNIARALGKSVEVNFPALDEPRTGKKTGKR